MLRFPARQLLVLGVCLLLVAVYGSPPATALQAQEIQTALLRNIPGGWVGRGIAVTPDGQRLYAPSSNTTIAAIDTDTFEQLASITVCRDPAGIAITPDGAYVYVVSGCGGFPGAVAVIRTSDNTVIKTLRDVAAVPWGIAISPDGQFAYVTEDANGFNTVAVIRTSDHSVVGHISGVGNRSRGIAVTPDGRYVYVTSFASSTISVIDTSVSRVIKTIPVSGGFLAGVAVTPDGQYAYVANGAQLVVIRTLDHSVDATIQLPSGASAIAFTPDGKYAYVGAGLLHVIRTADRTVVETLDTTGAGGWNDFAALAVSPTKNHVYVTNSIDRIISVFTYEVLPPCTLPAFGDASGNPIQQHTAEMRVPYGGAEFDLPGRGRVFLPFRSVEGDDTIYRWGCYLISGAMVINYYAAQQGKSPTDPIALNDWMAHNLTNNNAGYRIGRLLDDSGNVVDPQNATHVEGSGVNPWTLVQYAKEKGIDLAVDGTVHTEGRTDANDALLNEALCALNPAIVTVNNDGGSHFVAVTGKTRAHDTDTWRIHDPLSPAPTNLLDAYNNTYDFWHPNVQGQLVNDSRLVIFKGAKPQCALLLVLHSPAELVVTDPQGRRTGLDPRNGNSYAEIPSSSYGQEFLTADEQPLDVIEYKALDIGTPLSGQYVVEIIGTGNGTIGLDVVPIDTNGDGLRITIADSIAPGIANVYRLTYSATPGQPAQLVRLVAVDIEPGSDPNSINPKSQGKIPVAILSTANFDATTRVDKTSLTFGRTGDEQSLAFCNKSAEDVNGDGLLDQVCHFHTQLTGFQVGDTEGILKGQTVDGVSIEGRDSVRIVNR